MRRLSACMVVLILAVSACGPGGGGAPEEVQGSGRDQELGPEGALLPVNGTEIFVKTLGEDSGGWPVLVVHGGPVMEHGYLLPGLEALAPFHRLVFFDQRLSGRSAGVVDSASVRVDTLVQDMEAIRRALELPRFHLLAHSWGAFLALRYALAYPDRVSSLVLVSPMAGSADLHQAEARALAERATEDFRRESRRLSSAPGIAEGDTAAIASLLRHSFRLQFHDPAGADRLRLFVPTDYLERSRQFGYLRPELSTYDLHPALGTLEVPALILYGAAEPGVELGGAALRAALPDARMELISEAGHFAFLERRTRFQEVVRDFLARVEREGGGP